MLRLRLLGALTAEIDGRPVTMPSSERARALIGWLALHPGCHARNTVAARLWPDAPQAAARASLRTSVWAVRQAWGPAADVIVSSRLEIGIPAGRMWVDVLDDTAAAGDEALLPGIDDEWADEARAAHVERRRQSLAEAAAEAEKDGRWDDAVRFARERCRLDPLDETAHRALLDRLTAAGDKAGAVRAARDFTEVLRSELGVRPAPATRAAHARLRTGTTADRRPALFGRGPQLQRLTSVWRTAADGAGQVVVLSGEAGIGKTSLLAEAVHRVSTGGGRTAVAAGTGAVGETPFALWLELARQLVATVVPPPRGAGWPVELSRLSPELGARLGHPEAPPAVTAPELERLRVFESVLRLVEWSCVDRPALIAVDDAHRADRVSLRLTAHVGRRLTQLPLLLVVARRDRPARPELDAVLADLAGRSVPVTEIHLGPVSDAEVAAIAASLLVDDTAAPVDDAVVRKVITAAEGNPLLAVESARVLAAGGAGPPPNLRTAVRATCGLLPADAQTLINLLAAAGRPLASAELDGLGMPGLGLAEEAASADGLLVRRDGRLGFRHELLREAVYADLPNPAPLHDRIAVALDHRDRAEVAHHLSLAGRDEQAAGEWAAAAAYARSVGALTEAAEFLTRAVDRTPGAGDLWLELEEIRAWLGQHAEMEVAWERALALLDPADIAPVWCRRGRQLRTVVCHPEASLRAYRRAEAFLTDASSAATRADVLIGLAWGEAVAGDPAAADDLLAAAEAFLPPQPDPEVRADIVEIRMQGLIRQGRFAESAAIAEAAGPDAARRGLPGRAYALWLNAACALACAGDYDGALAFADRAVATTEPVPVLLLGSLAARAHILARLERHTEAADTTRRQRSLAERLDSPALAATAAHDAGLVALAAGDHAEAAARLGEALDARAAVSRPSAGLFRAEALALAGDARAAAAQLRAAMLEPVGRADQPWALVPRIAWVQGLIARVRDDRVLARRRFEEAAAGWRSMLDAVSEITAEGYTAALVDLGRPPVAGLVEPRRELERVENAMTSWR
ncbi:ATP-binding protein [Paractinoplanes globisporus]|uniref:ATP-binding protein n=1 Tax=Paractinoplanes globisporus TaxID=113565 RepID=A0ABW6W8K4_9ACTN|nr:AAA family ATPase [Actinoplanes globisporus]